MTEPMIARAGELTPPTSVHDRRFARRAEGLLAQANERGILLPADVHVAMRVAAAAGESDEEVLLAFALTVRAVRTGSVAADLRAGGDIDPDFPWPGDPGAWLAKVRRSPLVARGVLRIDFGLVYLERYWEQERQVADLLLDRGSATARAAGIAPIDEGALRAALTRLFPDERDTDQRAASEAAARHASTIVTGGPGTGKTTTIARILAVLAEQAALADGFHVPRIALAAPTAKAAGRLTEAFAGARAGLPEADRARVPELTATTVHRLLGWTPQSRSRFRHNRDNRLPHDIVVVDEASMVSLTLMARLTEALRPTARLIIAGDPDQLASVEAGAVLADLVAGLEDHASPPAEVARLRHTYRFGGAIERLASAVREGAAEEALGILTSGDATVTLMPDPIERRGLMVEAAVALHRHARAGDAEAALADLARHRLLCAHRTGPFGVSHWNRQIGQWLSEETGENFWAPMYPGRPLLVTTNDYGMDLYNGDTGVVVVRDGRLVAAFDSHPVRREVAASRLSDVETMYAATVHKSQGSQAERVTVILPDLDSPLLTRELIYTAITRAQREVAVIGSPEAIRAGLARRIQRASGLRERLRGR